MTTDSPPRMLHPAFESEGCKPELSLTELEHTPHPQVHCQSSLYSILSTTPFFPRSLSNFFFKRAEKNNGGSETMPIQSKRIRELNLKQSSTRNIPNELLLQIFQFFCSSSEHGDSCPQIILGAVSSIWRSLVMNAPELWETFSVSVTRESLQTIVPLLWMYCKRQRRGSFPSSIRMDFEGLDYFGSNSNGNVLESLLHLENAIFASEGSTQITTMKLHCPPLHWVTTNAAYCSNLHDLSLSYTSQNIGTFSWSNQYRLSPLANLRVLRLDNVPITLCFELLQASTELIEFHCTPLIRSKVNESDGWNDGQNWMINRPQIEIIFPRLNHLTWTPKAKFWDNYFLRFYRFPNLRCLSWPIWLGQHSREEFDTFVSALPEDLERFEMIYVPSSLMPWCRYQKILEKVPRAIKYLVFREFPPSSHARLLEILQSGQAPLYTILKQSEDGRCEPFRFETVNVKMHPREWKMDL